MLSITNHQENANQNHNETPLYTQQYGYYKEKKGGTNELIYKTEVESQMQKTNLWLPGDKGWAGGRDELGDWD